MGGICSLSLLPIPYVCHAHHCMPDVGVWCNTLACVSMASASLGYVYPLILYFDAIPSYVYFHA